MKKCITLISLMIFVYHFQYGQISFTNGENSIAGLSVSSGAPMAVADMNGDGLDDIVSLDDTRNLFISFQNPDGSFNVVDYPTVGSSNWGMTVADVDNDGRYEILTGGAYDEVYLVKFLDDGTLDTRFLDGPSIFVQAVSYFDIDNDGFLDAVACHDDGPNGVYKNDGAGELSYMADGVPFEKFSTQEANAGNYGNVWSDVNGDGLMDYYIAKCRQGVTSTTDGRRINQLWINNGDGTFTESAEEFGLAIGFQSWTAEFQDIDNDGDMDCLITNHDGPTQLFENLNNTSFVDITANSGISVAGVPIQAVMRDFDNDGFVDAFVTGTTGDFFRNNGDKTFTRISTIELNLVGGENSFATGDLNHDGFVDFMAGYGTGFNGPTSRDDRMWINDANDNHWLAVELEGVASNKGGVGSRIEIYGDWGMMVREVRAGEGYGVSHSLTKHFGIGAATTLDSIVVSWPSGQEDRYYDLAADQFVKLKEGTCIAPPSNLIVDGPTIFCTGDDVTLSAPEGFQYQWNNGSTSSAITVNASGLYNVSISDGSECEATSTSIEVVVDPEETFEIFASNTLVACEGTGVVLNNDLDQPVTWSTGDESLKLVVNETSTVSAITEGTCGEIISNEVNVEIIPTPSEPINLDFEHLDNGQVLLTADGQGVTWYADESGQELLGFGNEFLAENILSSTTVYALASSEANGGIVNAGESQHTGASEYNSDNFNGALVFDVLESMILRTVLMDTDIAGEREIQLRDSNGDLLQSMTQMFEIGQTKVRLNFTIEPGSGYFLTTDAQTNFESIGTESPRFKRSSVDFGSILRYPYEVNNLMEITGSNFGPGFYYYFYDWEVSPNVEACVSELVPLEIILLNTQSISENTAISLSPNPSNGLFKLSYQDAQSFDVQVLSVDGRSIMEAKAQHAEYNIDLSSFQAGVYILRMDAGEDTYFAKMVKL